MEESNITMEDSNITQRSGSSSLSYDETVSLVSDVIKRQFRELKTDLRHDSEKALDVVSKKLEHKSARIEFKFEGNKRQYEFNSDLQQELESMKSKIETTSIEDLEEQLENMVKKLRHRTKLIKIADRSKGGWTTVYEYERGDVADNSDDEKKIRRAESRAVKRKRFLPRRQADSSRQQLPQRQSLFRAFSSEKEETAICWRCGQIGHFRNRCSNNIARVMSQPSNGAQQYQFPVYHNSIPVVWGSGAPAQKVPETQGIQKRIQ